MKYLVAILIISVAITFFSCFTSSHVFFNSVELNDAYSNWSPLEQQVLSQIIYKVVNFDRNRETIFFDYTDSPKAEESLGFGGKSYFDKLEPSDKLKIQELFKQYNNVNSHPSKICLTNIATDYKKSIIMKSEYDNLLRKYDLKKTWNIFLDDFLIHRLLIKFHILLF